MFYQLPPAGNRIDCRVQRGDKDRIADFFPADVHFFNSGAASLAAAVLAVVQHSGLEHPEVLLPAYACPELVSAVLYAGARPVLVDFAVDRPWMDLSVMAEKLTLQTCAVIAVNLFGIPERLGDIREVLQGRSIWLIEDSAQAFPEKESSYIERGDLTIYSFGRGKPVSVFGGGAVLAWNAEIGERVARIHNDVGQDESHRWVSRLKIEVYNHLISPRLYWLPDMLPFIQLGTTIYHPLSAIKQMDKFELDLLGKNIEEYWLRNRVAQNALMSRIADSGNDAVIDLARVSCKEMMPRLLRYPLLARTPELRDELCERFNRKGLGVSKMYPTTLQKINGLESQFSTSDVTPSAESFSQRIFTLPVHGEVRGKDISEMLRVIG